MTARRCALAALATALLAGCGTLSGGTHVDGPGRRLLDIEALGACPGTPSPAPVADAAALLGRPGAWVRLTSVAADAGPGRVAATYDVLGGDPEHVAALVPGELDLPGGMARAAATALGVGAEVTVHTGPATYAFATASYDEWAFLGDCAFPVRVGVYRKYQQDARAYLAAITGERVREVRRLLALHPTSLLWETTPPERRTISRDDTPPRVLARLARGTVSFAVPEEWQGVGVVFTRAPGVGGNEGIDLNSPSVRGLGVTYYVDPSDPRLEVWFHEEEPGTRPVRLATVDVRALMRDKGGVLRAGGNAASLKVWLPASPTLRQVADDPTRAARAVVRVTIG